MKKILISTVILAMGLGAEAQDNAITKYFSSWQNDAGFTKIQVSPAMFNLFEHVEGETPEEKEFINAVESIEGLSVLSCEECKNGSDMYKTAIASLGKSFEELILIQEGSANVNILIRENGGVVKELVIVANDLEDGGFALVDIWGSIDLKQIMKVTKALAATDLPEIGAEKLESARKVKLYPNPVQTNADITLELEEDYAGKSYVIHDFQGKEIRRNNIDRQSIRIPVQGFSKGQYVLSIIESGKKISSHTFTVL